VFVENASEAESIIRSKCDPGELIRISPQKLSMEDVFVHIVSQLEKQSQAPVQTAAVSTESV
jgi:hypothetical protein